MRRYYIASSILLILHITDFVVAAPVQVQEKRYAPVDMELVSEDAMAMLGKRGDDELDDLIFAYENYFAQPGLVHEDHFAKPEEPAASPSSTSPPSGPADEGTDVGKTLPTISESEEPPEEESDHELAGVHPPLSTPVLSSWFHQDPGLMEAHAPQPGSALSSMRPSTESDSDQMLVAEEPPSKPPSPTNLDVDHEYEVVHSPTESDYEMSEPEMVDVAPSEPGSVSSTNPSRRSMGRDSVGEFSSC